jgi:hypothetical protein
MGNNTPKKNRTDETLADQALIDGFGKHTAAIPSIVIGGVVRTAAELVATVQSRVDASKDVVSTKASWLAALHAETTLRDATAEFVSGVRRCILVAFAGQVDTLADFGLTPRKLRVDTPEQKLASAAKARATRAARHTMGSRQKAAIKG